MNKVSRYQ